MPPDPGQPRSSPTGAFLSGESLFPGAWQPLTPAGVAAFAFSSGRRLFVVQSIVAVLAVSTLLGVLHHAALPVFRDAILQLPDQGDITNRVLVTSLTNTTLLARSSHLAVVADAPGRGLKGLRSDFRVWFRSREVAVCSLFGCLVLRYPRDWTVAFNRQEMLPAIDAWIPIADVAVAVGFLVLLFVLWTCLASVFFPIPMLVTRYSDRPLPFRAGWKLSGAGLLPGAMLATAGLAIYGAGWISLAQLLGVGLLHLMVSWLYLVLAPLSLPRRDALERAQNPFASPSLPTEDSPPKSQNPFL